MKHRKLFALLMTLVMLLGMVPAGHAEGGNMMPGGEVTVSCNHNWSWRWPNGKPANCKDWKMSEEYCTKCGAVGQRYEQCGACRPGSWHWDGNPPADCTEWGIQNLSCAVCGEMYDERNAQGSHKWGGYATDTPAGCEPPGEKSIRCTVCGQKGKIQEIPPTGHDWGKWVWDGEPSCTEGGWQHRTCNRCKHR